VTYDEYKVGERSSPSPNLEFPISFTIVSGIRLAREINCDPEIPKKSSELIISSRFEKNVFWIDIPMRDVM
jgi:hypothetical protein